MTKRLGLVCLVALTSLAAACGGGGDPKANLDSGPDEVTCVAPVVTGPIMTPAGQTAEVTVNPMDMTQKRIDGGGRLTEGTFQHLLVFQFFTGFEPFTNPVAFKTGTFNLNGAQSSFDLCGICVFLFARVNGNTFEQAYFPTNGSINITAFDDTPGTGKLTGTISNLELAHVDQDANGNQIDPGTGCTASIPQIVIDWNVVAATAATAGRKGPGMMRVGIPFDLATGATGKMDVQNWNQAPQQY